MPQSTMVCFILFLSGVEQMPLTTFLGPNVSTEMQDILTIRININFGCKATLSIYYPSLNGCIPWIHPQNKLPVRLWFPEWKRKCQTQASEGDGSKPCLTLRLELLMVIYLLETDSLETAYPCQSWENGQKLSSTFTRKQLLFTLIIWTNYTCNEFCNISLLHQRVSVTWMENSLRFFCLFCFHRYHTQCLVYNGVWEIFMKWIKAQIHHSSSPSSSFLFLLPSLLLPPLLLFPPSFK